jgi:hypothetical protein
MCRSIARRQNSFMKAILPAIGGRKSRMASWSMAPAMITHPGLGTSGMAGPAPGDLVGGPVGHPGTIGVSITASAGVAALAKSLGRAATRRGPGGGPTGTATGRAASWLGGGVTRQTPQVTSTPGRAPMAGLACDGGMPRTQRFITRAHTTHAPGSCLPVSAQACRTFTAACWRGGETDGSGTAMRRNSLSRL